MVGASLVVGSKPHSPILAILAALAVGVVAGACSGIFIAWVRLPAFVVTLGMLSAVRSEEHTSELQSQSNLVCRLLLEKKKTNISSASSTHSRIVPCPTIFST